MNPVRNFDKIGGKKDISNGVKKIVIVAGDKSGDLYGGHLSRCLNEKFKSVEICSFGGPHLAQHSRQIIDLLRHSVCGIAEVLSSLKKILDIFKETLENIQKIRPDLIILIDFPDFNLKLAKTLNKKYPLIYYVSPQVWAWRKKRVGLIKKYVDKMSVIFKFEKDFYQKEGVDALYFGHPLLEIIEPRNSEPKKIISFLPGSRKNEVKKHLPVMLKAKDILQENLNDYQFRIIRPANLEESFYARFSPDIPVVSHSYPTIEESKFIIASSGTATVEIAVLEIPYIIIYKVNLLSWQVLKRMVDTPSIGMVNILAAERIIPELLQQDANPENIARISLQYLKDKNKYLALKNELKKIKDLLSPQGATERISDFIGRFLNLAS